MKFKSLMTIALAGFFVFSCNNKTEESNVDIVEEETLDNEIIDMHNAEIALDWNGTYEGILPCADCEGIQTVLILNPDLTYSLNTEYLGVETPTTDSLSGNFKWDISGNIIQLEGIEEGERSPFFKVEENRVRQLDMEGLEITGDIGEKYILTKQ